MNDVILDLDGVLFKGQTPIPGAAEALRILLGAGIRVTYVTNNSTRSAARAAENIESIIGVEVDASQVVTSSQAAASILVSEDWPVLPVGEEGVTAALAEAGVPTTDEPTTARSVVVGMDQAITYDIIANAADAVRAGARFVATNADPTYPTHGRLLPGAGAVVAAISTASGREPEIAGKPHLPVKTLLHSRGIADAWVIGDRLDTDIALADTEPGWRSILVLTGVTSRGEAIAGQADHVVDDLTAAVDLVLGRAGPQ